MKPSRNDPCHCGSGKKYKNCHARTDAAESPALRLLGHDTSTGRKARTLAAIAHPVAWEADVTPVPATVATHPNARSVAVLLAAEGLVLHSDLVMGPPAGAAGVATLLADAIATLIGSGGAVPSELYVRHAAVAEQLAPLLEQHGVSVNAIGVLPVLDDFAAGLRQHLSGGSIPLPAVCCPPTWAAWEFPADRVHALHAAAANFYTLKPWELLANADVLDLTMPSGSHWFASVMGEAGETFGLALYESLDDIMALLNAPDNRAALIPLQFVVLSLTFDFRADLPKPMRKEAADAGWPIAGPSAYPVLWAMNTIGGGVSESQVGDLATALDVIARLAARLDPENNADPVKGVWTDDASGTVVRFSAPAEYQPLWDVPAELSPSLAEGARAGRVADEQSDADLLARFVDASRTLGTNEKRITQDEGNVAHFIEVMRAEHRINLPALTEFDLRVFLYDLMPRKTLGAKSHGHAMRQSLKRFFAYLAASEELNYPWAAPILGDKFALDERWDSRPDGFSPDDDFAWSAELMDDLAARVMLPQPPVASDFNGVMRPIEAGLYEEIQRIWLAWRDEEIRAGAREPEALRERLAARQAAWDSTPQAALDGRSPAEAISAERKTTRRISRRR